MTTQPSFTIDRQTWNRGKMPDSCLLSRQHGRMCCLGHIAIQCGFTPKQIVSLTTPASLYGSGRIDFDLKGHTLSPSQEWYLNTFTEAGNKCPNNNSLSLKAININDTIEEYAMLSKNEIEPELIKHFASAGISVTFTN